MMWFEKTSRLLLLAALWLGVAGVSALAQSSAQEQAAQLRAQLEEVKSNQTEQQTRLQELDEALKPENIERSLAGFGSVHPEELRAQRRHQLEVQRLGVQNQLDQLALSRTRLEKAVAAAEARAYQDSARGPDAMTHGPQAPVAEPSATATTTRPRKTVRHRRRSRSVSKQ